MVAFDLQNSLLFWIGEFVQARHVALDSRVQRLIHLQVYQEPMVYWVPNKTLGYSVTKAMVLLSFCSYPRAGKQPYKGSKGLRVERSLTWLKTEM